MRAGAIGAAIFLSGLLTGCVATAPRIENRTAATELGKIEQWQANGRLGVTGSAGGGSGSFNWEQERDHSTIQLSGPIGVGSLRLNIEGPIVRVQTSDGQVLEGGAAADELRNRLGTEVPAEKLRYWLLGIAAPGPHRWLDANLTQLDQDGWHIEYQNFLEQDGLRLPTKLVATSGAARVRLLVDRWQIGR